MTWPSHSIGDMNGWNFRIGTKYPLEFDSSFYLLINQLINQVIHLILCKKLLSVKEFRLNFILKHMKEVSAAFLLAII